jgi:hypothetical protein
MDWLERNPVRDKVDVQFLTNEVLRFGAVLVRRTQEHEEQLSLLPGDGPGNTMSVGGSVVGRGHWRGCVPYLRIIMCLTQDSVNCRFLTRTDSRSRQELDARNSENR